MDQNGRFSIGGLASGDYFVQGNPPADSPYIGSNPVQVTVVATDTTCSPINVGDLALRAPGLRGRVLEPDGDPVARAGLTIRKADRSLSFGAGTDENGLFRTSPMPDGDYVVNANPPGGSDLGSSLPVTITGVVSGTTKDVGDIRLTLLSAIGRVLLPDGNPALKTSVHIYTGSRNVDKHAGTDSRGIFRISGLDPGVYWLELDVPWDSTGLIAPPAQQVTVVAGQTTNLLDISYLRATKHISGQVLKRNSDSTTSAVAGAIVNANKDDGKARAGEKTGADGRYTLDVGGGVWLVGVGPDRSPGAPAVDWTYGQPPTSVSFKPDTTEEAK
ncbi:MAG: carboxypeptidase-like regulatory domain-containing protein, partial [Chloroflexota bacterium]|nr:carboxypeptidase-like regulatory domain-containing protein [Chloroflexota bacterium]